MNQEIYSLFDESIRLELNIAELYRIFKVALPDDADFWWRLLIEEKNHAALIRSGKESFAPRGKFPFDLLSTSLQKLRDFNTDIVSLIRKYQSTCLSREDAFNIALKLEKSCGEIHFQKFMEKRVDSGLARIFQKLNRGNQDHSMRIRSYMEDHGIELKNRD